MTRKYRKYTDQDIINNAKNVNSMAKLLKALGLRAAGGNHINMNRLIQKLNIDTKHWVGEGLKKHLIKKRGHKCEKCNLSKWLLQPIMLELKHISGDRTNNQEENLLLLCPNCHAQTPTRRNRKQ